MTNPNTQLVRRDLQLCVASGPNAPPLPSTRIPGASHKTHTRADTHTHTQREANPSQTLKQSAFFSFPI